jgi:hypothetical protein
MVTDSHPPEYPQPQNEVRDALAASGVEFLRNATAGTRVVVRYRLKPGAGAGATDALGFVHMSDATHCVVSTKRGLESIAFSDVFAAKEVPPAPMRRTARSGDAIEG